MIMITEIMILKWKQAIHYASFLFSRCYVYLCLYWLDKKLELCLPVTFIFNKNSVWANQN